MPRAKQQEKMLSLDKLLDGIEKANKNDAKAYTSGHLNHNHLFKPQVLDKQSFWKRENKHDHLQLSQKKTLHCATDGKVNGMKDSLAKITLKTSLLHGYKLEATSLPSLVIKHASPVTPINTPFASSFLESHTQEDVLDKVEFEDLAVSFQGEELDLPDLKPLNLEYSSIRTSRQDFDPLYHFEPIYFAGVTKTDQYKMFLQFSREILQKDDVTKIFSKNISAERHERELAKELLKISHVKPPHFARLQLFSKTLENICSGSFMFGNIVRQVKAAYDLYIEYLLDAQTSTQYEVLMSEINGMKKRAVKTQDVQESVQVLRKLEHQARIVLDVNEQIRNSLKLELSSAKDTKICNETPPSLPEMSRDDACNSKEINVFKTKRREILTICNEVQDLEEEISNHMTHAANAEATGQYIKDVQAETVRYQSSNEFLMRANKDLDSEIRRILTKQKLDLKTQNEIKGLIEFYTSAEE
ncbi:uncharacterized protein C6orf118 homolog [Pelodytes ibericus]